ncbi:histidine utilization repressor, partial [Shewanella sp. 11B5]
MTLLSKKPRAADMAQAKFAQIKQFILSRIETGEWQENDRVP